MRVGLFVDDGRVSLLFTKQARALFVSAASCRNMLTYTGRSEAIVG